VTIVGEIAVSDMPKARHSRTVSIQRHREKIVEDNTVTIIDADRGEVIVLNQVTRTYTVSNLMAQPRIAPVAVSALQPLRPVFRATSEKRAIVGYQCHVFDGVVSTPKGDRMIEEFFAKAGPGVTEYLDFYAALMSKIRHKGTDASSTNLRGLPMSLSTSFKPRCVFPASIPSAQVKAIEQRLGRNPPTVMKEWVTNVSVAEIPDSSFGVPPATRNCNWPHCRMNRGFQRTAFVLKKRFSGRGSPRFSRSVSPSYSRRKMPRRYSSGTMRSTKSSRPPGTYGNMMLNPSQPSLISHSSIWSAIIAGVPTIANPP
jgi:hypothetical protein